MNNSNTKNQSTLIIRKLADGIDPVSGATFPADSVYTTITARSSLNDDFSLPDSVSEQEKIQLRKSRAKSFHTNLSRRINPINYVSAPCGTGKTYQLARHFVDTNYCQNNLAAFLTIKLAEQFAKELDKVPFGNFTGIHYTIITSDTHPGRVCDAIKEYLAQSEEMGGVLITTHEGLLGLKCFPNKHNWNVFIDEMPKVDDHVPYHLPDNYHYILDYINVSHAGEFHATTAYLVTVKPEKRSALHKLVNGYKDTVKDDFIQFYRDLLSAYKDVFISGRSLEVLQSGGNEQVDIVSMLKPTQLFNWTVMSANFENSMMYMWFTRKHNVLFNDFTPISSNLRVVPDKNVTLSYCLENPYSKTIRIKDNNNVGLQVDSLISSYAGDDEWLYICNLNWPFSHPQFKRIPPKSHGLNEHQHMTNIAFNYSENRHPAHIRILESLGIDSDEIKQATYCQTIYQGIYRSELRDPSMDSGCHFIVSDKVVADYLKTVLGKHTTVQKIGNIRTGSSTLNKNQIDTRNRNKNLIPDLLTPDVIDNISDDIFIATFNEEKYGGTNSIQQFKSAKDLLKTLSKLASTVRKETEPNAFINAGVFLDENSARSRDNFIHSSLMILKFDNGQFSPDDFINLFWNGCDKKLKHTFLICNSWSISEKEPNSFIVFMPTNRRMASIDEFHIVYDYVMNRILELESDPKIDPDCRSGVISVDLPCINIDQQDWMPYKPYGSIRQLLPVDVIIDNQTTEKTNSR